MSNRYLKRNMVKLELLLSLPLALDPLQAFSISVNITAIQKPKALAPPLIAQLPLHSRCNPSGSPFGSIFTIDLESTCFYYLSYQWNLSHCDLSPGLFWLPPERYSSRSHSYLPTIPYHPKVIPFK